MTPYSCTGYQYMVIKQIACIRQNFKSDLINNSILLAA
jgi:hypothetical protein